MRRDPTSPFSTALLAWTVLCATAATVLAAVPVEQTYGDGSDDDQDDMAVWVHPSDPALSTIIGSDKGAGKLFVYDLDGSVLQTITSPKPGNVDVRYGIDLGSGCSDLVAFNEREDDLIRVYSVDPITRLLERVDDGEITIDGSYGFTLYRHDDGRLFAYTGPKSGGSVIRQYHLFDNGSGQIAGAPTDWRFDESTVEGMVGDDETGHVYLAEEEEGIWRVDALDASDKTLIAAAGDASGLARDVEGIAIYYGRNGSGYLIASSQGANKFTVFERSPPHAPVGEFTVSGAGDSDGIEVVNVALGDRYPRGLFALHNGDDCCPVLGARWDDVAAELGRPAIDAIDTTYRDARLRARTCAAISPEPTLPAATTTTTTTVPAADPPATTTTTTMPSTGSEGCGDFDGDTSLSVIDALGILKSLTGGTQCPVERCDATGDGAVTIDDALAVLLEAVGLPSALVCPRRLDPPPDPEPKPEPDPEPDPQPDPLPAPAPSESKGIWTSAEELASLPTSGAAWQNLLAEADRDVVAPDVSDQNDSANVRVLAKALVYARTGEPRYRREVIESCMAAVGSEAGGRTLALGRELMAYVVAADLVGLDPDDDRLFREWIDDVRTVTLDGRTLISTHEDRPNNWGTHAGASRIAVAVYLDDRVDLDRAADVFRGFLGERAVYAGFDYGELSWQADPSAPVGINPVGATKDGHSIDGVLPDDQRRASSFRWPPPRENYVYEALQGALAQAVLLWRAGYDVWEWGDRALLRAYLWLHDEAGFPAEGDDTWQPHVVNHYYGTGFPAPTPARPGKNVGWTDWTHQR